MSLSSGDEAHAPLPGRRRPRERHDPDSLVLWPARGIEMSVHDRVLHTVMNENILATAARLSDDALLARVLVLTQQSRQVTVELLAHLAELDRRKLYRGQGTGRLFPYCTEVLRLSEAAACNRIKAARAVRRFPVVLDLLADGRVNLTTIRLLSPHLTAENHRAVLAEATGKTKRQVAKIVARLAPQPDVPPSIRKLPASRPSANAAGPWPTRRHAKDEAGDDPAFGERQRSERRIDGGRSSGDDTSPVVAPFAPALPGGVHDRRGGRGELRRSRTCSAARSQTAIWPPSSFAGSNCSCAKRRRGSSRRRRSRGRAAAQSPGRVTSPRTSSARSGGAMAVAAHSWRRMAAGARNAATSSTTTCCRMVTRGRRRWRTSRCGAATTTSTSPT